MKTFDKIFKIFHNMPGQKREEHSDYFDQKRVDGDASMERQIL